MAGRRISLVMPRSVHWEAETETPDFAVLLTLRGVHDSGLTSEIYIVC